MKYQLKDKTENSVRVEFSLNAKEWEAEVEAAYQKTKNNYKKEGFRQGKVPRKVLENTYGKYVFYEDAFNDAFPKYYTEMLKKETELYPVDYPEIGIDKMDEKGVEFHAILNLLPNFEVKKYTGYTIEKAKVSVKKSEIEAELKSYQERNARFVEVTDRKVENGDLVNLDYSGKVDGKVFEGGTAKDQELEIGSHMFIPGFEEQMVGMAIGEEKDLNVKFPETYHAEELKGKDAVFTVKVLGIRKKELPELNDEFAKEVSEFESLQALTLDIEQRLADQKAHHAEHEAEDKLIRAIVNPVELKVPTAMVEKQLDYYVEDLTKRLSYQGLDKETYFKYIGKTEEDFRKDNRKDAEFSVKTSLVMEEISTKEKIEATKKDVEEKLEELAKLYNQKPEELKAQMTPELENSIRHEIVSEKLLKFLKANNTIK